MFFQGNLAAYIVVFICSATFVTAAAFLPAEEIDALQLIAKTMGKTDWNFSADPCSGEWGWVTPNATNGFENAVTCTPNCSSTNGSCHIISIVLKSQNLSGELPPELVRLPYLQEIDLARTYLNGTIPPGWGSMQLVNISIYGSRVSGPIPKELGNISTLEKLVLEFNQLSGPIPLELGNLSRITQLHLTSNNLTGELPRSLANLTTLNDFRIGDNNFTGKIPDFIQNWINLEILEIQGSGLDGPIPAGIAVLKNLSDLRISDLDGAEMSFPNLRSMNKLEILILRSCNIVGGLPDYLVNMGALETLDLSFNKLTGNFSSSFVALPDTGYIYLTGNSFSGTVPNWLLQRRHNIDLSYNNFTHDGLGDTGCQNDKINLFNSFSEDNTSQLISCLGSTTCPRTHTYFHINCGGREVIDDKSTVYEADTDAGGATRFFMISNWAFSSTGRFLEGNMRDNFTRTSPSPLSMKNSDLYMNARLSPLSLTYYGFCLQNGRYIVHLHFAEIMFTDDRTYSSLGRRIFDIYIQRKLEVEDFNIAAEAGGVSKEIVKRFTAVVTNGRLEIRFHWAGKGTTMGGVYGPLISAVSVALDQNGNRISAGTIVGIVFAAAFVIFLALGTLWWKGYLPCGDTLKRRLKGLSLQTGSFTLRQIKAATNNFDKANKIGEGGFGPVYKGILSDGTTIAVKQLSSKSKQGNREFLNEVGMFSALQHPHLVKLHGCCIEGDQLLLVYEYMENNSLAHALFGKEESQLKLDWPTRHKICIGIARGLAFLHEESRLKIVHRDIKATNVLLDKHLNPKISDFGLAKLDEEDDTHISTRIAGTYGYMAPEYAMRGHLTDKADVYSFGVVALEIVSGRTNTSHRKKGDSFYLLDWALALKEKGNLLELVDPRLGSDFNEEEVMVMIKVALLCTDVSLAVRPTMSSVVSMLEGRAAVQELVPSPSASSDSMKFLEMKNPYLHSHETRMSDSLIKSVSTDGPWTASSSSAADLYPVKLDSDYYRN